MPLSSGMTLYRSSTSLALGRLVACLIWLFVSGLGVRGFLPDFRLRLATTTTVFVSLSRRRRSPSENVEGPKSFGRQQQRTSIYATGLPYRNETITTDSSSFTSPSTDTTANTVMSALSSSSTTTAPVLQVEDGEPLQHFLETVIRLQAQDADSIRLVDDDYRLPFLEYNDEQTCRRVNSLVFEVVSDSMGSLMEEIGDSSISLNRTRRKRPYVLAILDEQDRVNVTALEECCISWGVASNERYATLRLAKSDQVREICGFAPGTIPPRIGLTPPPLVTCLEQSLLHPHATDGGSRNTRGRPQRRTDFVLGGGVGLPGKQSLVAMSTLLQQPNVQVASFRQLTPSSPLGSSILPTSTSSPYPKKNGVSLSPSLPASIQKIQSSPPDGKILAAPSQEQQSETWTLKPFFAVEAPPAEEARLLVQDPDRPNHLVPTWVSVVGRIGAVRRMARRLVFYDLIPPNASLARASTSRDEDESRTDDENMAEEQDSDHPWRCGVTGQDMAVQLIGGKTFCQRIGGDEERAALALRRLKPGHLVWIQGKTNVGNRESLRNWLDKKSLDIVMFSYRILLEEGEDSEESIPVAPVSSCLPAMALLAPETTAIRHPIKQPTGEAHSYLRLADLFAETCAMARPDVSIVDNLDRLKSFSSDLTQVLFSITTRPNQGESKLHDDYGVGLVGVDTEWLPSFYLKSASEPQPVLLLQVFIHPSKKVYLFDLQTLLRPLLMPGGSMNEVESLFADCMGVLLTSKRLLKVGFHLAQDLRRLAASYPHLSCFHEVKGVLELSTLGKKVMHLMRQRNSRFITSSLSRLTERFLGKGLSKDEQCSNWSERPLTESQIEYASLDAVVLPIVAERMMQSVDAKFFEKPSLGRWNDDTAFSRSLNSWRFLFIDSDAESDVLRKLNAKRIVGEHFVVTQNWLTGEKAPGLPSLPSNGGEGPYIDLNGVPRMPASVLSIATHGVNEVIEAVTGETVGKSKDKCLALVLSKVELPENAKIDFPQRSGYVEFHDAVVLFVSMPVRPGRGQPRSYPNEWLEDGQILTWFVREHEWKSGTSSLARKMLPCDATGMTPFVVLFARTGKGPYVCCGRCRVIAPFGKISDPEEWKLVRLHLILEDWTKKLHKSVDFLTMVSPSRAPVDNNYDSFSSDGDNQGLWKD